MTLPTQIYSTTRQNRKRPLANNIVANNAILMTLKEKGHIKDAGGGRDIGEPLIHAEYDSETVKWFDGYETFTVDTSQEVITEAVYDWKELGGFAFISQGEERKNRGEHQAVSLVSAKDQALQTTLKNKTETSLAGDGTGAGGKEIGGLQLLVADSPSSAGSVGGIDQMANAFWRNQTSVTAEAITSSNITSKMNALLLATTFGTDQPDLWLGDSVCYLAYLESLQADMRHSSPKMADAGFVTVTYMGKPVVYTSSLLASRMYALNTDYLLLRTNGKMYEDLPEQKIQGGFYTLFPNYSMFQLTTNGRRFHGVLGDNT